MLGIFGNVEETKLFDPIQVGAWSLRNRIAMAPMTRCFADNETGVVGADVVEYRKRVRWNWTNYYRRNCH